jgi:tRNA (cytidine/uridine-2'-O-)-methyltransferase
MPHLVPDQFELALFQPQIAPNVGNIGRLCVATGTRLHLVRPLGFVLSDTKLKRAGLDYWPRLQLTIHDDTESFLRATESRRLWFFDSEATHDLFAVPFQTGDILCLGSETRGIDPALLSVRKEFTVRIPQVEGERCLNLSTSAGIVLYTAIGRGSMGR